MPEIRLELPAETVRKLDTEVDLLGFADREAYLRWIVGNRAAIEQGTERDQLLTAYQARVDELESQLEADDGGDDADRKWTADDASGRQPAGAESGDREPASGSGEPASASPATDGSGTATGGGSGAGSGTTTADGSSAGDRPADARGVDREDGDADRSEPDDADVVAVGGNFRPERVERFEDESLGSQADQLQGVEGERLDEFARRAVAKTRERLGREPSTGLDYRSGTRIARSSSDVRPGEDLVDLDALDVPGRSEEARAPRREAVGAALAYLRDAGRAKRADFVAECYDEYPAGYDTADSWWRCVKRGLKDAPVVDGGDGSRVWTYEPPGSREGELVGGGPTRVVDPE